MMSFAFKDAKASARYGIFLYVLILAYIVSLYVKNAPVLSNSLMFLIFLLAFISAPPASYKDIFLKQKVCLGIALFFLVQVISVLFSSDKTDGFDILSLRLPLFIFPLAFCLIDFERKTWQNILLFYVLVTTIASIAGFLYGAHMASQEENSAYYYNDNISELLLGKQAAYFGLYVNAAILTAVYILQNTEKRFKGLKIVLYVSLTWLLFINYMLASKMSTISLGIILLCIVFIQIIRKRKILEGLILVVVLVIGLIALDKLFPKTINRFKTITQTSFRFDNTNPENSLDDKFDANKWSSGSTRMAVWTCGKEIFVKHPIFGTGLGDIRNALKEKYIEKNFIYAIDTKKNLHCQYFDVAVSMGVVGLLLFLITYFLYPIKVFISNKQDFAVSIFICIGLCLLTENMFDRYQGEEIIALLLPLSAKIFNEEKQVTA
jgi:O-antigen ligase